MHRGRYLVAKWHSELPKGHTWNEELFENTLRALALKYCSTTAWQEQKRFMKCNIGLPGDQLTLVLFSPLHQFNRYISYLPGVRNKFDPDNIREMLYNTLLSYVTNITATADNKWYDEQKVDSTLTNYFDQLFVLTYLD
jgi:hypothetical protein